MSTAQKPAYPILPLKLILTSTKAYFTPTRTFEYLHQLLDLLPRYSHQDLAFGFIPDFLTIHACSQLTSQHTPPLLHLGAQDTSPFADYGPYTGFVLPKALKHLGVSVVELGHAERRKFVGEDDALVAKKAAAVCAEGMIPLVCIGELDKPNLSGPMSASIGAAMRQLSPQITSLVAAIPSDAPVIFAYEPVWAIGAAQPAGVEYVGPVVQAVREIINGTGRTGQTKVVYGGSAGPGLWSGATNGGNGLGEWVDGMFLGRFAHEISGVEKVLREVVASLEKDR